MQLEGLQSLSDNQPARFSAVITDRGPSPLENHISYTTPGDTIDRKAACNCLINRNNACQQARKLFRLPAFKRGNRWVLLKEGLPKFYLNSD
jgi:hypothetical protein